jgi:hypothetical protein
MTRIVTTTLPPGAKVQDGFRVLPANTETFDVDQCGLLLNTVM